MFRRVEQLTQALVHRFETAQPPDSQLDQACQALGFAVEEFKPRAFEEFAQPFKGVQVQQLRHDHFESRRVSKLRTVARFLAEQEATPQRRRSTHLFLTEPVKFQDHTPTVQANLHELRQTSAHRLRLLRKRLSDRQVKAELSRKATLESEKAKAQVVDQRVRRILAKKHHDIAQRELSALRQQRSSSFLKTQRSSSLERTVPRIP